MRNAMKATLGKYAATIAVTVALATPALAQSNSLDELIKAAEAEGSVVLDSASSRYPQSTGDRLSEALKAKFGVDIEIKPGRQGRRADFRRTADRGTQVRDNAGL